jgi:hypothetical protein
LVYAVVAACGGGSQREVREDYVSADDYGSERVTAPVPAVEQGRKRAPASTRKPSEAHDTSEAYANAPDDVRINGVLLGEPDLARLEVVVGGRPEPGRFWYDARSGLWGLIGHGAGGVTKPGLPAAPMLADVSRGGSRVRVNDRLITLTERRVMVRLLGGSEKDSVTYIGQYTLDEQGKLYRLGGAYLGNLARAAEKLRAKGAPELEHCAWLSLGHRRGVLGRGVTVACD